MPDGLPLVLLHGFPMDHRIWDAIVGAEIDRRFVAAWPMFDLPAGPFTVDDLADELHRAAAAGGPCVLGGLSMGGYVALSLIDRYPADVAGLILFDTKATADDAAGRANRDRMIALAHADGAAEIAAEMGPKLLSPNATAEVREGFRSMAERVPAATMAHALAAMRDRPDRTAMLGRIGVPTLCVVGADDAATPPAVVDAMRRAIPTAGPLATIAGAGHVPPMENAAATAAVVRRFLDGL